LWTKSRRRRLPARPAGCALALIGAGVLAGCGSGDSTVANTPQGTGGAAPSSAAPPATSAPAADPCAVDLAAPAIAEAVSALPRDPRSRQPWSTEPVAGNYNRCTQLSAVIIAANTNAGHPNTRAVMFHQGQFIAQGVPDSYGFDGLDASQCTDDIVALRASSGIGALKSVVKFRWNGDGVELIGNTPAG
jgi:hypothetical protein